MSTQVNSALIMELVRLTAVRRRTHLTILIALAAVLGALMGGALLLGARWYEPHDVLAVLLGQDIQGVSFAVRSVRLPRMLAGLLVGLAFGIGGSTFQTMLRNTLASPDIIGITAGSSLAAVFAILALHASGLAVSALSVVAGLGLSLLIFFLAQRGHFSGGRLILIGIGVQALSQAGISLLMVRANQYDIPAAMRWLTGSLNGARLDHIPPLAAAVLGGGILIAGLLQALSMLELGDDTATSLGVATQVLRGILVIGAVILIAVASSQSGPIAFVAFLAGPLAFRLVGPGPRRIMAAGLVGAILVLGADLAGQFAFSTKYPVGVITGILGAPYLIIALISMNKAGTAT